MSNSTPIFPIQINDHIRDTSYNTYPSATYNYDVNNCYFDSFLTDTDNNLIGLSYTYYSNSPSITIKPNHTLKNVDMYYTSRFVIVPIIHDLFNNQESIYSNDLEMIIEHYPDQKNASQVNLYTCFIFTTDISKNTFIDGGLKTLFDGVNISNLKAAISNKNNKTNSINSAKLDNLKQANISLSLNRDMFNLRSKDLNLVKDAFYYLDKKSNIFILFNHPIFISSSNYEVLAYAPNPNDSLFKRPVDITKIFSSTDFKIKSDTAPYEIPFSYAYDVSNIKQGFTTLKENFSNLREGLQGNGLIGNYVYCRPADSSNGSKLVTTTINQYANNVENQSNILLNDLTMIFVIVIVFIFMCLFSPVWFMYSGEKILGYTAGFFIWVLRAFTFILFFAGGVALIIVSRTDPKSPEWLFILGLLMIIGYILFYAVVFFFQKRNIYDQLKELIIDQTNDDEKRKIKDFTEKMFGYME